MRVYRVALGDPEREATPEPLTHCLRGDIAEGFRLVVYEGGSVVELVLCTESRDVATLYALHGDVYVSYILGAPEFVNREFRELFADGLPAITPLVAKSGGGRGARRPLSPVATAVLRGPRPDRGLFATQTGSDGDRPAESSQYGTCRRRALGPAPRRDDPLRPAPPRAGVLRTARSELA